jgi:hypothetical protein
MSKRRKGFPSETNVKRGVRIVHGDKLLMEKLGILSNASGPTVGLRVLWVGRASGGCLERRRGVEVSEWFAGVTSVPQ